MILDECRSDLEWVEVKVDALKERFAFPSSWFACLLLFLFGPREYLRRRSALRYVERLSMGGINCILLQQPQIDVLRETNAPRIVIHAIEDAIAERFVSSVRSGERPRWVTAVPSGKPGEFTCDFSAGADEAKDADLEVARKLEDLAEQYFREVCHFSNAPMYDFSDESVQFAISCKTVTRYIQLNFTRDLYISFD